MRRLAQQQYEKLNEQRVFGLPVELAEARGRYEALTEVVELLEKGEEDGNYGTL